MITNSPTKVSADVIKTIPLFEEVDAYSLNLLTAGSKLFTVQARNLVLDYGDLTTDVLFVIEGKIRVLLQPVDGGFPRILGDFEAGQYVGELAAIDGQPRSAQVHSLTRSSFCAVPALVFLAVAAKNQNVSLKIMRMLTERIRLLSEILIQQITLPARLRIAAELLRVSQLHEDGRLIIKPIPTQQDLANRVGCARETVSREMKALVAEGLLEHNREYIVIIKPDEVYKLIQ